MKMERVRKIAGALLFWLSGLLMGIWFSTNYFPTDIENPVGLEVLLLLPEIFYPAIFAFLAIIAFLFLYRASGKE